MNGPVVLLRLKLEAGAFLGDGAEILAPGSSRRGRAKISEEAIQLLHLVIAIVESPGFNINWNALFVNSFVRHLGYLGTL